MNSALAHQDYKVKLSKETFKPIKTKKVFIQLRVVRQAVSEPLVCLNFKGPPLLWQHQKGSAKIRRLRTTALSSSHRDMAVWVYLSDRQCCQMVV